MYSRVSSVRLNLWERDQDLLLPLDVVSLFLSPIEIVLVYSEGKPPHPILIRRLAIFTKMYAIEFITLVDFTPRTTWNETDTTRRRNRPVIKWGPLIY